MKWNELKAAVVSIMLMTPLLCLKPPILDTKQWSRKKSWCWAVSVGRLARVPAFLSFIWRVGKKREEDEEEKLLFKHFTPAGPVYAFLANLYSGLADVGRRLLCAVLFPAFLCLSAPPLRTCSLAIVCLYGGLAASLASGEPGQNAKWHRLPGRSSNMNRWIILETVDTEVRISKYIVKNSSVLYLPI